MGKFKIVFEIELEAETPLDAAKETQRWLRKDDWQYYVQCTETEKIYSVDLQEEDTDAVLPADNYKPLIKNKDMYHLKNNQYLPNGFGKPAATYYYFVNDKGQTIDTKTLKPYRGKQMNRFVIHNKTEAENFLEKINK